jgi:hypothetical protein
MADDFCKFFNETVRRHTLQVSDGKRHLITELHQMSSDYEAIEAALRHLTEEERVYVDGPYLIKN